MVVVVVNIAAAVLQDHCIIYRDLETYSCTKATCVFSRSLVTVLLLFSVDSATNYEFGEITLNVC